MSCIRTRAHPFLFPIYQIDEKITLNKISTIKYKPSYLIRILSRYSLTTSTVQVHLQTNTSMMSAATTSPQRASDSGASEENDSNHLIVASDTSAPDVSSIPSTENPSTEQTATKSTTATTGSTALPSAAEFEPPLACIRRILKNALPSSTNVGKDASAAFARASGIFIIYLTACANDFARENKRQTITANDVLAAIKVC